MGPSRGGGLAALLLALAGCSQSQDLLTLRVGGEDRRPERASFDPADSVSRVDEVEMVI